MVQLTEPHRMILALCAEDHVGLWFVIPHIEDFYRGDDRALIRTKTLVVLRDLLDAGLVHAGNPALDGGAFLSWNLSPVETVARISREWDELGRDPSIGDIVWFTVTAAGERLAAELGSDTGSPQR